MDYYPTDTIQDQQQFTAQPNTEAPIVAVNPYQTQRQGSRYQLVNPRVIVGTMGAIALLVIGALAMRSTAISADAPIKIAPLEEPKVSIEKVNQEILDGSVEDLNRLIFSSEQRLDADKLALKNERAKDITTWANKLVTDRNSDCFKSVHGRKCYLSVFITEQAERYRDAYRSRKWQAANSALFEIESARIAWIGAVDLPLDGDATAAAIENELSKKKSIELQSANAQAAEINNRGKK